MFAIVFCGTGLVVTPFLPGDSLLFAADALAAIEQSGTLDVVTLWLLLVAAAILRDTVHYTFGKYFDERLFDWKLPFIKRQYLARTNEFYAKYGGKTIKNNFSIVTAIIIVISVVPMLVDIVRARRQRPAVRVQESR